MATAAWDSSWSWLYLAVLLSVASMLNLARGFDIRRHLATKTRYAYRLGVPNAPSVYKLPDPEGYEAVHLYLLARHGTRWPTGDRMTQINSLEELFKDARNTMDHPWVQNWTAPFTDIGFVGGELHPIGADELWGLAYRLRKRFPGIAKQAYFPKRFPIVSTQVARTAASANAFASGFFPTEGAPNPHDDAPDVAPAPRSALAKAAALAAGATARHLQAETGQGLGLLASDAHDQLDESLRDAPGPDMRRPQAVAMAMSPKLKDPLLRFFDVCPAFAQHDEYTEKWISSWMQGNWSLLIPSLERRLGMSRDLSPCEVEAVWQLCLLEAGLHNDVSRACSLFEPEEVLMLEWIDDVHLLETQSYGAAINYEIAAPLLHDVVSTLQEVAWGKDDAPAARLMFAHCETLVPLATLLGLFRPDSQQPAAIEASGEVMSSVVSPKSAQRHLQQLDALEDLQLRVQRLRAYTSEDAHTCYKNKPIAPDSVPPPEGWQPMIPNDDNRLYKGARIAPYGTNLALVLYRRTSKALNGAQPKYLVRLLYNEQVVPVPGCRASGTGSDLDCALEDFLEAVQGKVDPDALQRLCGPGASA